jgi:hypothetical protein
MTKNLKRSDEFKCTASVSRESPVVKFQRSTALSDWNYANNNGDTDANNCKLLTHTRPKTSAQLQK